MHVGARHEMAGEGEFPAALHVKAGVTSRFRFPPPLAPNQNSHFSIFDTDGCGDVYLPL
jgi:hypothetical protein